MRTWWFISNELEYHIDEGVWKKWFVGEDVRWGCGRAGMEGRGVVGSVGGNACV